jgi:hypothetical protein
MASFLALSIRSAIPADSQLDRRMDQQEEVKNAKRRTHEEVARILAAVILLSGLGVAAKAESTTEIVVTLPFQFVASGKTLPAGTYTAGRLTDGRFTGLRLTNRANGASVFVLPNEVESTSAYKPKVSFKQVGEQHFLSAIQTANEVYNIPVYRSVILEAAAKPRGTVSVSGSAGGR